MREQPSTLRVGSTGLCPSPGWAVERTGNSVSPLQLVVSAEAKKRMRAGFSPDGLKWSWSDVEPYDNAVPRANGNTQFFATMERPKFLCESPG